MSIAATATSRDSPSSFRFGALAPKPSRHSSRKRTPGRNPMPADKRMTDDQVVGELCDGMTVGIGGWGSRRKPMSIVRAILRSSLKDLTIVSYGGPDVGLLCASGQARKV